MLFDYKMDVDTSTYKILYRLSNQYENILLVTTIFFLLHYTLEKKFIE